MNNVSITGTDIIPFGSEFFEKLYFPKFVGWGHSKRSYYCRCLQGFLTGYKTFLPALNLEVSISEFQLDERGTLCFRNEPWIPEYEPLQTALIHEVHDPYTTSHPIRNKTSAIISRKFFRPVITTKVGIFCQNRDIYGRSHVWRSTRHGLSLSLPDLERFHGELSVNYMIYLPAKKINSQNYWW